MLDTVKNLAFRRQLEEFVDNCELRLPAEVARLFREYTWLVWDYKLVGKIYDFYADDAIMYVEDGQTVTGVETVVANTLAFTAAVPDNESLFVDIFAEEDGEGGYRFIQATRCTGTCTGPTANGPGTGRSLSEGGRDCIGLCECLVKKVDGRWKIVSEWMVRSTRAIDQTMTPGAPPFVFDNSKVGVYSETKQEFPNQFETEDDAGAAETRENTPETGGETAGAEME